MSLLNYCGENFPTTRLRRNRRHQWLRDLVAENRLSAHDLILPLFVCEGQNQKQEIPNLSDIYRYSIDNIIDIVKQAQNIGIKAIMLFPYIDNKLKTVDGKEAINPNNLICRTIIAIKKSAPDIGIIGDVALDPYTTHGHDGIIDKNDNVINDQTTELLCQQSLIQAQAGCDIIAPSDMMDGRVGKIRNYLDKNNYRDTAIMSYSIKFASNFYGPFRNAVGSNQIDKKIDKKTYQMDFRNFKEAMREIAQDIKEGADSVIIKPGMPYLDIIKEASQIFNIPIISYQVSGEYAMLKNAAKLNIFNYESAMIESLISFKRSGCQAIICYDAIKIAQIIKNS